MKQFFSFGIIGTIGFIVDAIILLLMVNLFFFSVSFSRFLSFLCAVFVTWILNRSFTFNKKNKNSLKKEYGYYLFIQTLGAIVNYGIFISLVKNFEFFENYLIIPLAIASLTAMFFNFFMIKKKVFN